MAGRPGCGNVSAHQFHRLAVLSVGVVGCACLVAAGCKPPAVIFEATLALYLTWRTADPAKPGGSR